MRSKQTGRLTTVAERKAKKPATLPERWSPRFLADADQRQAVIKEIRRRIKRLQSDSGCDSFQKEMLVGRAVFLHAHLETMETKALEGKDEFDYGRYAQGVNALTGLLRAIGLDPKTKLQPWIADDGGD